MSVASWKAAGEKARADIAGLTSETAANTDQRVREYILNPVQNLVNGLDFSGGPHPETPIQLVSSVLHKATTAVQGPHGGLVPTSLTPSSPGPTSGPVPITGGVPSAGAPAWTPSGQTLKVSKQIKTYFANIGRPKVPRPTSNPGA